MRLLLILLGLLIAAPVGAEDGPLQEDEEEEKRIWFYVDDAGLVTFVDSLELVPVRFRERAQPTNLVVEPDTAPPREVARPRPRPAPVEDEPTPTPEPAPPSPEERLAQLRGERQELLDELGALEEGWSEQPDLTAEALERRSLQLEQRLQTVDREIDALEKRLR